MKLEQQSVCAQELVRALAIAGVTQPSSVPAVLSLTKGQKGGLYKEVWDMKNVMETYLPVNQNLKRIRTLKLIFMHEFHPYINPIFNNYYFYHDKILK